MEKLCPNCNNPYELEYFEKTGKCSECGKMIKEPQKYGTTRYAKATPKTSGKRKVNQTQNEPAVLDNKQINKDIQEEASKAVKKATDNKKINDEATDVQYTDNNNSDKIYQKGIDIPKEPSGSDDADDEINQLLKKLEEEKKRNAELEEEKKRREQSEKNEEAERIKRIQEEKEAERKRQKEAILRQIEEEKRKNKEIQSELDNHNAHQEEKKGGESLVSENKPTKEELLAERENRRIEESKNRLFNRNSFKTPVEKTDITEVDEFYSPTPSPEETKQNDINENKSSDWLKEKLAAQKKTNEEELEIEGIEYASNCDGYYNDINSRSKVKADTIPKMFFLKIVGIIVGMFGFIAFVIYYA